MSKNEMLEMLRDESMWTRKEHKPSLKMSAGPVAYSAANANYYSNNLRGSIAC